VGLHPTLAEAEREMMVRLGDGRKFGGVVVATEATTGWS